MAATWPARLYNINTTGACRKQCAVCSQALCAHRADREPRQDEGAAAANAASEAGLPVPWVHLGQGVGGAVSCLWCVGGCMCQEEEVGVSEGLNSPPSLSPSLRSRPATRNRHPTQWSSPEKLLPPTWSLTQPSEKGQKSLSFNRLQSAVLAQPIPTLSSEHGHNARQREGSVLRGH